MSPRPIIIQRKKRAGGEEGHGGAWKIAYADFVTAMMAFFLLMWLLNVTSPDQKNGIAEYFNPVRVSQSRAGSDGVLAGAALGPAGALQAPMPASAIVTRLHGGDERPDEAHERQEAQEQARERERRSFDAAEQELRRAVAASPELRALAANLVIDRTAEGLRIQLVDSAEQPMFELGSPRPLPRTRDLLAAVGRTIAKLPNRISIRGHTDALPYAGGGYGNWDLSADRALASRQALAAAGVEDRRVDNIVGRADRDPLFPADPKDPRNRRISILLLNEASPGGGGGQAVTGAEG